MSGWEIMFAFVAGLIVNEMCDVSPWLAKRLVWWSAHLRYQNPMRAEVRAEELIALIDSRPGKLLKLFTAIVFLGAGAGVHVWEYQRDRRREARYRRDNPSLVTLTLKSTVKLTWGRPRKPFLAAEEYWRRVTQGFRGAAGGEQRSGG
ncbi:hypothetical protein [Nonomuraea sp. NPDC003754]